MTNVVPINVEERLNQSLAKSDFTSCYPDYAEYMLAQAHEPAFAYAYRLGETFLSAFKREKLEPRNKAVAFFIKSPAHRHLWVYLSKTAIYNLKHGSAHIWAPLSDVRKEMCLHGSDRKAARIILEAEDLGFIKRTTASWNKTISLVYVTPVALTAWVKWCAENWYPSVVEGGLHQSSREIWEHGSKLSPTNKDTAPFVFSKSLDGLEAATEEATNTAVLVDSVL